MKQLLTQAPVQQFPLFPQDFARHALVSEAGAGASLAQQEGSDLVVIPRGSQRFTDSQRHYSATLKECSRCGVGNTALAALFMGTTLCACHGSFMRN